MRFRKLRIAWSIFWGVAAALLIAVWVRSYWNYYAITYIDSRFGAVSLFFYRGSSGLEINHLSTPPATQLWDVKSIPFSKDLPLLPGNKIVDGMQLRSYRGSHFTGVVFPIPLLALIAAALAAVPQLSYRFSLRTLLIVTTFVAAVLGLVVWAAR